MAAARAYPAREGTLTGVSRSHVERIEHDGQEHAVKLGVWLANPDARERLRKGVAALTQYKTREGHL